MLHHSTAVERIDIAVGEHRQAAITKKRTDKFANTGKQATPNVYIVTARRADIYSPVLHTPLFFGILLCYATVAQQTAQCSGITGRYCIAVFMKRIY